MPGYNPPETLSELSRGSARRKGAPILLFLIRVSRGAWVPNALVHLAQAFFCPRYFCRALGTKQLAVSQQHPLLLKNVSDNLFPVFLG